MVSDDLCVLEVLLVFDYGMFFVIWRTDVGTLAVQIDIHTPFRHSRFLAHLRFLLPPTDHDTAAASAHDSGAIGFCIPSTTVGTVSGTDSRLA